MAFFLGWIILSGLCAVYASSKGLSAPAFFFVSVVLSPLIGFIAAAISKPNAAVVEKRQMASGEMKKCPYCAELVKAEAVLCRYCGREFKSTSRAEAVVTAESIEHVFKNPSASDAPPTQMFGFKIQAPAQTPAQQRPTPQQTSEPPIEPVTKDNIETMAKHYGVTEK